MVKGFIFNSAILFSLVITDQIPKFDSILNVLVNAHDSVKYKLYTEIADEYYYDNQLTKSSEYYLKAANHELKNSTPSNRRLSESYGNCGYCYREMGKYNEAMKWYNLALKYATEEDDSSELSALYINIGNTHLLKGNYKESIQSFKTALKIDLNQKNEENISNDYCNLGKVYNACGRHKEAIDFYRQALNIAIKYNVKSEIIVRLNNIGASYKALNQMDSANYYFKTAAKLDSIVYNDANNSLPKAKSVNQILKGESYFYSELYKKVKTTNPRDEINKLYNEGLICLDENNLKQACNLFSKSLKKAEEIGLTQEIISISKALAETYSKMGDFKRAYLYHIKYEPIEDSLFNDANINSINEFLVQYETEKKENEIKILNQQKKIQELQIKESKQRFLYVLFIALLFTFIMIILWRQNQNRKRINTLLAEKNKNLDLLNSTKDRFFTIISHDLKNPTTAFANITGAINKNFDSLSKTDLKAYINDLNTSAKNILAMLKNILEWAKIQKNTLDFETKQFNLFETVVKSINMASSLLNEKKITIINLLKNDSIVNSNEQSVITIINNLLTNAIKFSDTGKTITIGSFEKNAYIHVYIEDQGIGMAQEDVEKLFKIEVNTKTIGNSNEKGTGMGLIICKELVTKIGGSIYAESKLHEGTRFIFTLPV